MIYYYLVTIEYLKLTKISDIVVYMPLKITNRFGFLVKYARTH